jgi:hypothetical protein
MSLLHGATASIASTSHVRKLTMPFAKYVITAYDIGVALNGMTVMQSFVKISQLLPTLNEGHAEISQSGFVCFTGSIVVYKGDNGWFVNKIQFTATPKAN